jgi:hypothetical protein
MTHGTARRSHLSAILARPIAGLAPILLLSTGWILLSLVVLPWVRDRVADTMLRGGEPHMATIWPLPNPVSLVAGITVSLFLIGFVLLVIWMRSTRGLGCLLDRLTDRTGSLAGMVLLAAGVLTVSVLARGEPSLGDARTHITRGWFWQEALRSGEIPIWTDLWYGGTPVDQHYPPLAHILQALIGLVGFVPGDASKILSWLCRISGAVGFALLCREVHRDGRAGVLGGIIYGLAPTFHLAWMWDGRLPGSLVIAILPWAFLAAERVSTGIGGSRAGAGLGLSLWLLSLAHTTEIRLAFALVLLFVLLRLASTIEARGWRAPSWTGLLIGGTGGRVLVGFFLYPIARDADLLVAIRQAKPIGLGLSVPHARELLDLLRWNPAGKHYLGASVVLLGFLGLVRAIAERSRVSVGIGPAALAVFMILPWFLHPPQQRSLDIMFIGGILAAARMARRVPGARFSFQEKPGLLAGMLVLIFFDLAPITLITTYGVHRGERDRIYDRLQERIQSGRFLELPEDRNGRPQTTVWSYALARPIPSVGGPFPQGAPLSWAHQQAMVDAVAEAMIAPLPRELVSLLAFHNIRYVLVTNRTSGTRMAQVVSPGLTEDPDLPGLMVDAASPVFVIDSNAPPPPTAPHLRIVDGMPESPPLSLAAADAAWIEAARPHPVLDARASVLPNRMDVEIPDVGATTVRIERSPYPYTKVRIDGKESPWREGPLGGMLIDIGPGPHHVEIRGVEEPVRRACRYAQWGTAGLLIIMMFSSRRKS